MKPGMHCIGMVSLMLMTKARMPAGAETRDPYPAGEYNARLKQRAETGVVEDELVEGKELEVVIA